MKNQCATLNCYFIEKKIYSNEYVFFLDKYIIYNNERKEERISNNIKENFSCVDS